MIKNSNIENGRYEKSVDEIYCSTREIVREYPSEISEFVLSNNKKIKIKIIEQSVINDVKNLFLYLLITSLILTN